MLAIAASSDADGQRERDLVRLFCKRRVDGLLIVPADDDHEYMLPELRSGTQVVFIDRPPVELDADVVPLDNMGGARIAVEHLIAQSTAPADSPPRRVVLPIALIVRGSGEVKP